MKIGFLIKVDKSGKAELVASGPVVPLKQRYATEKLNAGEVLHLAGPSIRYRKRGDASDWTALSAVIEKENAAMRERDA